MLSWDTPAALFLLGLALPMALLVVRAIARLRAREARFADPELLDRMAVRRPEVQDAARLGALLLAFVLGVVAAAGPRWGGHAADRLPGEAPALLVAVDVSRSMGCQDVTPDRLGQAKEVLAALLEGLPGWHAGLLVFADEAMPFSPLTTDRSAIAVMAARLVPGQAEVRPGTNLEVAIRQGVAQLQGRPGALLLVTDGEGLAGKLGAAGELAQTAKVPVYALVSGTSSGARIPAGTDLFGAIQYRMGPDGQPALSMAHPEALVPVTERTGGQVIEAGRPGAASLLLRQLASRFGPQSVSTPGRTLYQFPLALAILLLFARSFRAPPTFKMHLALARLLRRLQAAWPAVWLLVLLSQNAASWPWAARLGEAEEAYRQGQWSKSLQAVVRARREAPQDPELAYDEGCARYQSGDYRGARDAFRAARDRAPQGSELRAWASYNLGNTLFRLGERSKDKRAPWTEAVAAYGDALRAAPQDADARFNRELVSRLLRELPPPAQGGQGTPSPSPSSQPQGAQGTPAPAGPSETEIQALLQALEAEERRYQPAPGQASPPPAPQNASELFRQLVEQAADPRARSDRPDW